MALGDTQAITYHSQTTEDTDVATSLAGEKCPDEIHEIQGLSEKGCSADGREADRKKVSIHSILLYCW